MAEETTEETTLTRPQFNRLVSNIKEKEKKNPTGNQIFANVIFTLNGKDKVIATGNYIFQNGLDQICDESKCITINGPKINDFSDYTNNCVKVSFNKLSMNSYEQSIVNGILKTGGKKRRKTRKSTHRRRQRKTRK